MTKHRSLIAPALIAGLALLLVAGVYIADSAASLPTFFPGHQAGSTHHHVKHGIAAALLGLGCLTYAWFQTGPAAAVDARR